MTPEYSTLFACLHDEQESIGSLGRGTHYSVLRSVEWLDVTRRPLEIPQIHDFSVIWDEDHDVRVMRAIERIYMAGLLSPVQFIGERKGMLTVILAARFYWMGDESHLAGYTRELENIGRQMMDSVGDSWPVEVGCFDRAPGNPHQNFYKGIIAADERRAGIYLSNIDSLWNLGTKAFVHKAAIPMVSPA